MYWHVIWFFKFFRVFIDMSLNFSDFSSFSLFYWHATLFLLFWHVTRFFKFFPVSLTCYSFLLTCHSVFLIFSSFFSFIDMPLYFSNFQVFSRFCWHVTQFLKFFQFSLTCYSFFDDMSSDNVPNSFVICEIIGKPNWMDFGWVFYYFILPQSIVCFTCYDCVSVLIGDSWCWVRRTIRFAQTFTGCVDWNFRSHICHSVCTYSLAIGLNGDESDFRPWWVVCHMHSIDEHRFTPQTK